MARSTRIHAPDEGGLFHCWNILNESHQSLKPAERTVFRDILMTIGELCDVDILNYALCPRRLDLLLGIRPRRAVEDSELVALSRRGEGEEKAAELARLLQSLPPRGLRGKTLRKKYTSRMFNLGFFMKHLNQQLSTALAKQRSIHGKFWHDRYRSLPVADSPEEIAAASATVTAAVIRESVRRAPSKYRFCGFGEAEKSSGKWRTHILRVTGMKTWPAARKAFTGLIAAQPPRLRTWNMPRSHGDVPVEKLRQKATRRWNRENPRNAAAVHGRRTLREHIRALVAYREQHGDFFVPKRYAKDRALARWIANLRQRHANDSVNPQTRAELDAIGFDWTRPPLGARKNPGLHAHSAHDRRWLQHFEKLAAFHKKHGHARVPRTFRDKFLVSWVARQRTVERAGKLDPDRREKLDSLGFEWFSAHQPKK